MLDVEDLISETPFGPNVHKFQHSRHCCCRYPAAIEKGEKPRIHLKKGLTSSQLCTANRVGA